MGSIHGNFFLFNHLNFKVNVSASNWTTHVKIFSYIILKSYNFIDDHIKSNIKIIKSSNN